MGMHGGSWTSAYAYDAAGHWLGATSDGGAGLTCTWQGDRLSSCAGDGWREDAVRDADGVLTAIVSGDDRYAVVRDRGRVVAVGDDIIRYDADGRVVTVGDRAVAYDDHGRIARITTPRFVEIWTYDDRGRLQRIVSQSPQAVALAENPLYIELDDDGDAGAVEPHRRTYAFEYDDRGRLTASRNLGSHEDDSSGTSYQYDCD